MASTPPAGRTSTAHVQPDTAAAIESIGRALEGMDRGAAVFQMVRVLLGDEPTEECAVYDPENDRVIAYIVPAAMRLAQKAALRREQRAETATPSDGELIAARPHGRANPEPAATKSDKVKNAS